MFPEYAFREVLEAKKLPVSTLKITNDQGNSLVFKAVFNKEKTDQYVSDQINTLVQKGHVVDSESEQAVAGKLIQLEEMAVKMVAAELEGKCLPEINGLSHEESRKIMVDAKKASLLAFWIRLQRYSKGEQMNGSPDGIYDFSLAVEGDREQVITDHFENMPSAYETLEENRLGD